jgi:hypothetical protein
MEKKKYLVNCRAPECERVIEIKLADPESLKRFRFYCVDCIAAAVKDSRGD